MIAKKCYEKHCAYMVGHSNSEHLNVLHSRVVGWNGDVVLGKIKDQIKERGKDHTCDRPSVITMQTLVMASDWGRAPREVENASFTTCSIAAPVRVRPVRYQKREIKKDQICFKES